MDGEEIVRIEQRWKLNSLNNLHFIILTLELPYITVSNFLIIKNKIKAKKKFKNFILMLCVLNEINKPTCSEGWKITT